jgi:thiol-disulfide isomerase/thioredoxin
MRAPLAALLACAPIIATVSEAHAAKDLRFALYDFSDRLVRSEHLQRKHKLVIVEFFSHDCKPCKSAMPAWIKLHRRYGKQGLGLVVVAVAGDASDREQAERITRAFFARQPVAFPVVWDKYNLVAKRYGVAKQGGLSLPQAFLLSAAGKLLGQARQPQAMEKLLINQLK